MNSNLSVARTILQVALLLSVWFSLTTLGGGANDDEDYGDDAIHFTGKVTSKTDKCLVPFLVNGRVKIRSRGRVAKFICRPFFQTLGKKFATCIRGRWSFPPPLCISQGCTKLTVPRNGRIAMEMKGALAKFYCNPGYTLAGSPSLFCDSVWWNSTAESSKCSPTLSDKLNSPTVCDFETDLCGWTQDTSDNFDFKRSSLTTPSGDMATGPSFDHTKGQSEQGYYLYIEASSPRKENDTARIFSPVYEGLGTGGYSGGCFRFWYHMYGDATGSLKVYVKTEQTMFENLAPSFVKSKNQGNNWYSETIRLSESIYRFQIVIEAIRGTGYASDIAIDDVMLFSKVECESILNLDSNDTTEAPDWLNSASPWEPTELTSPMSVTSFPPLSATTASPSSELKPLPPSITSNLPPDSAFDSSTVTAPPAAASGPSDVVEPPNSSRIDTSGWQFVTISFMGGQDTGVVASTPVMSLPVGPPIPSSASKAESIPAIYATATSPHTTTTQHQPPTPTTPISVPPTLPPISTTPPPVNTTLPPINTTLPPTNTTLLPTNTTLLPINTTLLPLTTTLPTLIAKTTSTKAPVAATLPSTTTTSSATTTTTTTPLPVRPTSILPIITPTTLKNFDNTAANSTTITSTTTTTQTPSLAKPIISITVKPTYKPITTVVTPRPTTTKPPTTEIATKPTITTTTTPPITTTTTIRPTTTTSPTKPTTVSPQTKPTTITSQIKPTTTKPTTKITTKTPTIKTTKRVLTLVPIKSTPTTPRSKPAVAMTTTKYVARGLTTTSSVRPSPAATTKSKYPPSTTRLPFPTRTTTTTTNTPASTTRGSSVRTTSSVTFKINPSPVTVPTSMKTISAVTSAITERSNLMDGSDTLSYITARPRAVLPPWTYLRTTPETDSSGQKRSNPYDTQARITRSSVSIPTIIGVSAVALVSIVVIAVVAKGVYKKRRLRQHLLNEDSDVRYLKDGEVRVEFADCCIKDDDL